MDKIYLINNEVSEVEHEEDNNNDTRPIDSIERTSDKREEIQDLQVD